MANRTFVLLLFILSISIEFHAQDQVLNDVLEAEEAQEVIDELDYSKTKEIWIPRQPKTRKVESRSSGPSFGSGFLVNIIFYVLIILVIMVIIGILINILSSIRIEDTVKSDNNIEELQEEAIDIHDIDLHKMLSDALEANNYKMAIRAKFLILLKSLSTNELINWSIEKTNRDYIRETRSQPFTDQFSFLASQFDRTWYGNFTIDQSTYSTLVPYFDNLTTYINSLIKQER